MIAQVKLWWKLLYSGQQKGIFAGLAAHSGQISVGLGQGFSAILIPKLLESNFADESETSWIASLGVISNPLGSVIAGLCAEWFGRRSAIALASLPHAAGWLLIALSKNVPMLYVGRFISGIGMGMANGLYLYVSEAAAPNQRAWLGSCGPVLVSLGVLIIYTLGAFTTWQRAAAISIGPAILSLALTRMIPESPGWLVARGRKEEAKVSLLWLRGPGLTTDKEYEELCETNDKREEKKESLLKAVHMPSVWKPFFILLAFFAFQQISGIYIILFYAVNVLKDIGIDLNEYSASVGVGVIRLFASIAGAGLANSFGRKVLAFVSGLGMTISAVGVALAFRFKLPSIVSLACIGGHVGSSMIGYLTLPWVMTSELYPLRFRGPLGGITTSIVQLITFATIKMYPDLRALVGIEWIMWIFSGASLLGALFALTILPETRGQSLDQIESAFCSKPKSDTSVPATLPTIFVQPKNITLQKFVSISEEKYPNMVANAYAYDNFSLELSPDDKVKAKNDELPLNINESDRNRDVARVISLEHVYF
ncbi:facilitated trehalose transporter Tret1-2 homolog isoform X2 [Osmia bicornis bicornis]|uniref:facilitated trehalose transporter Tret1-2 homolog isoform X2 n=1 Tax=Osmia bicornis bicornis TaxID=1437191 RepID=UPI0010F8C3FD|nr:facilitated trehalose transporter Tret1-2 homolog isoform X2 [Osmia bicornis bicornis]XP_029050614.1 facilitated trehalose transporter Tret1-2 homolog isoform X2 [Osmia bicornis bicornis]XP_029050615.1 facilitated trehalose transporter Tret1-2 homolog isoform X2 [Osmia bicornis bicornis]